MCVCVCARVCVCVCVRACVCVCVLHIVLFDSTLKEEGVIGHRSSPKHRLEDHV